MKPLNLLFFLLTTLTHSLFAQEKSTEVNRTQMTVMVVPFTSKGEDIRAKIENDFNYRAIINVIDKAFRDRGFSTKGFIEELKVASTADATSTMSQKDLWTTIQNNAPCDVFIYAEINIVTNSGNYVNFILDAKDKYSAETMAASGLLRSNDNNLTDYARHANQALTNNAAIDKFVEELNVKFKDISTNGRSVEVVIELNQTATLTFDDEIGSDYSTLGEIITGWVKKNSFKNYYKLKSQSAKKLWFETIKIPVKNDDGTQYRIEDFANLFRKYLRGLSAQTKSELKVTPLVTSGKIQFNIQ